MAVSPAISTGTAPSALDVQAPAAPRTADTFKALAQQFESLLIAQMLRDMQQPTFGGDSQESAFGGPLAATVSAEVAGALARAGGFGLAETLLSGFDPNLMTRGTSDRVRMATLMANVDVLPGVADSAGEGADAATGAADVAARAVAEVLAGRASERPFEMSQIGSAYGWRQDPFSGASKFHKGVDVPLALGEDVRSVRPGTVVEAKSRPDYGLTVVVDHGGGVQSRYAHLSSLQVSVGDAVAGGQVVGLAGKTGRATGTHLHFEVLESGQPVDPMSVHAMRILSGSPVTEVSAASADYVVEESPNENR